MVEWDEIVFYGLCFWIEDYFFVVDGFLVWFSIEEWICNYIFLYYFDSQIIFDDVEFQGWWMEICIKGYVDKVDEEWWLMFDSFEILVKILIIMIWIVLGYYVVVNFGQYDFVGFFLNQLCLVRKFVLEVDGFEFKDLLKDFYKFML